MKHARLSDLKEIYGHFQRRKDVFPHVRQNKLRRMIEACQVVWQDGVVITYQKYRKRTRVGDLARALNSDHAFRLQLLGGKVTAPSSLPAHYGNQSDSNSSRNLVMMLRHLRSAQRMMLRCWTVNSPSMIARFTMSSILSSIEQPELTS